MFSLGLYHIWCQLVVWPRPVPLTHKTIKKKKEHILIHDLFVFKAREVVLESLPRIIIKNHITVTHAKFYYVQILACCYLTLSISPPPLKKNPKKTVRPKKWASVSCNAKLLQWLVVMFVSGSQVARPPRSIVQGFIYLTNSSPNG